MKSQTNITWDIGSAYDFYISLIMLHEPAEYGLRSTWASGVRQRLPSREREALERLHEAAVMTPPLQWLYSLPEPKDVPTLLHELQEMNAVKRMSTLIGMEEGDSELRPLVKQVMTQELWGEDEQEELAAYYISTKGKNKPQGYVAKQLDCWAEAANLGERIMKALRTYYEVFFEDEERRILPALKTGLEKAQELSASHDVPGLLEELSQGVRYGEDTFKDVERLVLAPSFWASPFIFYAMGKTSIILFGARPDNASLDPGELVPDALMSTLNALSDPTRLRILRYLASESITSTQLAARLRLRTPTVTHHLKSLRSAGLIFVIPGPQKKEIHYQTRTERLDVICDMLKTFVSGVN